MPTSRFGRTNRRRFVASSALGGVASLAAGQIPLVKNRASAPAALAQDSSSDVPMFRGNAARTGEMPGPGPDDSNGVEVIWTFNITHDYLAPSPAVVDGVVYVGSADGNLYAIDANDGIERWRFPTGDSAGSSPVVIDGVVYVGTWKSSSEETNHLYALDAKDGAELWRFASESLVLSPAVADGIVYVGSGSSLYLLDAGDGTERWRLASGSGVLSSPTVADGVVCFWSDVELCAFSIEDGSEMWRVKPQSQGAISQAMVDGVVYVMNRLASPRPTALLAIDVKEGTERWRFETEGGHTAPAVVDGMVYIGGDNLFAVNAKDGTERWRFSANDESHNSPVVADGVVYFGSSAGNLYAVNANDGTERWRFAIGTNPVRSSPVVVDGMVYVVSDDGNLYAIGARVPRLRLGGTARVAEKTPLRGGPAPTAVERVQLEQDMVVSITGEPEKSSDATWWPVVVDDTGDQGWVEASMLEPLTSGPEPTATA